MPAPHPERRGPGRPSGARSGETREAILRATRELLAERGLPRVTLRGVARRAGVQPALVHYYFGDKQELFRAVIREVAAGVRDRIAEAALRPGPPEQRLANAVRAVTRAFAENPYAPRLLFEQVMFGEDAMLDEFVADYARPNLAVLRRLFEAGRRAGSLRELDPELVVPQVIGMTVIGFLGAPLFDRLFERDGIDAELAERFADSVAELLLHGVTARGAETS